MWKHKVRLEEFQEEALPLNIHNVVDLALEHPNYCIQRLLLHLPEFGVD